MDKLLGTEPRRLIASPLGISETIAALNRQKNVAQFPADLYNQLAARVLLDFKAMDTQPVSEQEILESITLIAKHNLNASDALYLYQLIELQSLMRMAGDAVILLATDKRLLRAAIAEGIEAIDPEVVSVTEVNQLLEIR